MKKIQVFIWFFVIAFCFSGISFAGEKATIAEVAQKVKEAVNLIKEKGDGAYPIIRDKKGPFVWKGCYLFVGDLEGRLLVHPMNNKLEGRNMMGSKDVKGKLFHAALVKGVKESPEGAFEDYWWIKPGEKKASPKVSFLMLVPGKDIFVGGGLYDITIAEAKKALQ